MARVTLKAITLTLKFMPGRCHKNAGRQNMKTRRWKLSLILILAIAAATFAEDKRRDDLKKPLVLASQGSFFVGGESKTLPPAPTPAGGRGPAPGAGFGSGDITINQMYVQYQTPV